ncbi:putative Ig domain-containing protein, partial [Flavobacterium sp.]|uniref:putative Ig domain-containing protein n=1 Tax=Flavobacterium sp. TaxID=239 RepID=UPI00286C2F28
NSGGSTTFDLVITVNDLKPSDLNYNTPNVFTKDAAISNLNPSVSGGTVISYSISPSLPLGLNFDTATGAISGTPTVISSATTYTVTANNSGGSSTFDLVITVNDVAPSALSYNSQNVFTNGTSIVSLFPIVSGSVIDYSITPSLPLGLNFDTATGAISGTPTVISSAITYTITANNSGGSITFDLIITVNDVAPSDLNYSTPNVFTKDAVISNLSPSVSGGTVISYSIAPSLPLGLNFDTATGAISGTPTVISSATTYTVTAYNLGGSSSFDLIITVNDIAPNMLSYTSPNLFIVGNPIASLWPSVIGDVIEYSVNPALPLGLSLNTISGEISGTPTAIFSTAVYTVTATNSGGSIAFDIEIAVDEMLNNHQNNFENITVYPNPFDNIIHLSSNVVGISYQVFSIDGKLIQTDQLQNNKIEFRDLPTGIYLLQLFAEGKSQTLKIIKR